MASRSAAFSRSREYPEVTIVFTISPMTPPKEAVRPLRTSLPELEAANLAISSSASVLREELIAFIPCFNETCPISCASIAATSSSLAAQRRRPRLMSTNPLGAPKALISSVSMMRKWYPLNVSGSTENTARLFPRVLRYSFAFGPSQGL